AGRDRYAVLRDRRLRHPRGPRRHDPRAGLDEAGTHRSGQGQRLLRRAPDGLLTGASELCSPLDMHNDPMSDPMTRRTRPWGPARGAGAALARAGGRGSSSSPPAATGSSHAPSLPVPKGVTLTPQGTRLDLGKTATVAWRPSQKKVGVAKIAVKHLDQ